MVNDESKSARVRVEGALNGESFVVERVMRRCVQVGPFGILFA